MIFGNNTHYGIGGVNYADTIPAMEGYDCVTGCGIMLMENQYNDYALFSAGIKMDMSEVNSYYNEGVQVINEGFKEIYNKIIELFKSLIAKIKGILQAFGAKILKFFHSNKKLVEKYKKIINGCTDWSKFKVNKFRKLKNDNFIDNYDIFNYNIVSSSTDGYGKCLADNDFENGKLYNIPFKSVSSMTNDEINEKIIKSKLNDKLKSVNGDMKNFKEVAMDAIHDTEQTIDSGWSSNDISSYGTILNNADKAKEVIKKQCDGLTKSINGIINSLSKAKEKIDDVVGDKDDSGQLANSYSVAGIDYNSDKNSVKFDTYKKNNSGNISNIDEAQTQQKIVSALSTIASHERDVITKLNSVFMDVFKFDIAQFRKVYSSAAAYASTHKSAKNESADLIEAIGEAAYYDFMTDIDSID